MKTFLNITIIEIAVAAVVVAIVQYRKRKQSEKSLIQGAKNLPPKTASSDDSEPSTTAESFGYGLSYSGIAALTAILIPLGLWFGLQVGLKWSGGREETPVMLTLVVLAGVIGLLAVLMMTALAFSAVKLADKTQALGLPEGSVRAVIALSLIVIFVITVVFLFEGLYPRQSTVEHLTLDQANAVPGSVLVSKRREDPEYEAKQKEASALQKKADDLKGENSPDAAETQDEANNAAKAADAAKKTADEANPAKKLYTVERYTDPSRSSEDFAKQIITTISTLVVSISAFYFGSSTAISAQKSATASSTPPVITTQPKDLKVSVGQSAEFSVVATGSNLSYQWQNVTDNGNTDISGATSNTYRIAQAKDTDNGSKFVCKISNPAGTITSSVATLTVTAQKSAAASSAATLSGPIITKNPADLEVHADDPAEFTVEATGSDLTYQWQSQKVTDHAATDIRDATTNTYQIPKAATADSGTKFSCKITNPAGETVISSVAKLTVTAQKSAAASSTATLSGPIITKNPADLEVHADDSAEFTVEATGSDLTYQWQSQKVTDHAATDIRDATTNTYQIPKAATADSGTKFSCKITNPAGTVTSKVATLTVTA